MRLQHWITLTFIVVLPLGCTAPEQAGSPAGKAVQSSEKEAAAPSNQAAAKKPRIALVMKSLANEFFKTMEQGARDYNAEHADEFELVVNGIKNEEDISGQVALVEQMMAIKVDALVIAPADSKALVSVLERATKSGIKVVNIDNKLDDAILAERNLQIPFVGPDNRKGARLAGEYLAAKLEPGAEVAIIGGIPSAFNAIQRKNGFEDAMAAGKMAIVESQSANWEMSKASQVVSGIVSEHPGLKALLCANDSMALGAVAALEDAGKLKDVLVVGYDNISAAQALVREGKMLCTVDQHADKLAVYGIQYALELLKTGTSPTNQETAVEVVSAEDLA